ncbi:YceI family protein [Hyunsoonleella aestuarii]|uniref:YceI family protein n=2 Tax=Hyunsoonleella aestuarii TaxID=912802 RepID=A0ABP8E8T9_9FLAO
MEILISFIEKLKVMQKFILLLSLFICLSFDLSSQSLISVLNTNKVTPDVNLVEIEIENSLINWKGSNLFKLKKHYGTVNFKSGYVIKKNGNIMGGEFVIEMNTITNTDGKFNEILVSHLKNEDFFDVKKYPLAKLKINIVEFNMDETLKFIGDLTIKGVTKEIQFDASFNVIDGNEVMSTKFEIDRTNWGINHESQETLGTLKDNIISNTIKFEVTAQWPFRDKC